MSEQGAQLEVTDQRVQFLSPSTGEILTLDSPSDDLVQLFRDLGGELDLIRQARALITREMLARFDRQARWTHRLGGCEVKTSSPKPIDQFDGPALHEALYQLVEEGLITVEAADAAVETEVLYRPRLQGVNALRSLGGRVAEVIAEHTTSVEKDRYLTVKPLRQGAVRD